MKFNISDNKKYSSALSPVIGTILLVGLTVLLFSFLSIMLFDQANDGGYEITNSHIEITEYGEVQVSDIGDADK